MGLQLWSAIIKLAAFQGSELAEARLWDCNNCGRSQIGPPGTSQNWRKPDCGIATVNTINETSIDSLDVRIGGSPIVGLQHINLPDKQLHILRQNWRKPDCGIATSEQPDPT